MAWAKRTATNYKDCLDQIRQLTQKTHHAGVVTPGANTGGGNLYNPSASENSAVETWTITCTTAGGNDVAIFSVSGSVSGAKASATAGVPYSISEVSFVIVSEGADFAVSDSFSFAVSSGSADWIQDRWDTSGEYELIQHGIGGGADEVYIGIRTISDSSTYWNFEQSGLTGYVTGNDFNAQPGYMPEWCCGNNAVFEFYVSFTSRRINFCLIPVEGTQELGGAGWLNSYASPSQWSSPNFSGGSRPSASTVIGGSGGNFPTGSNLSVLDGAITRNDPNVSPQNFGGFEGWRSGIDGNMRLYPAIPIYTATNSVYGEIDGMFWPTPYVPAGGVLTALATMLGTVEDFGGTTRQVCGITFRDVATTSAGDISLFDLTGD
jgi:hypothetical protein